MNIFFAFITSLLVLLLLLLLIPIGIKVRYSYLDGKFTKLIHAKIGIIQINITRFVRKKSKGQEEKIETEKKKLKFSDVKNGIAKGIEAVRYLKKKFTVKLFSLHVRMALGDVADTGIATGAGYASIYSLLGTIDRYFILKKYDVNITPVFQGFGFEAEFQGEFQLRLLYCFKLLNKIRKEDAV